MEDDDLNQLIDALQECIRELAMIRFTMAANAGAPPGDIIPGRVESNARAIIAPYLDIEGERLEKFLSGKLGRESFRPKVIEGDKSD